MRELSPQVRAFLQEPRFAVLATLNPDGTPQQTVIWYELRGDEIVMNTARGRLKERNLRRDPRLSLCLEDGYRYVSIRGTASLLDDQPAAQEDIRRLAILYHGEERGDEMSRELFSREERVTILVRLEDVLADGF